MVTRRNRVQVDYGVRAPEAATFNALNVPFIPATRRSGVGDNAARLASALQGFSASLGNLLGPMAEQEVKNQKALEADRQMFSSYNAGKDEREVAETKDWRQYVYGFDPNIRAAQTMVEFQDNILPQLQAQHDATLKAMTDRNWRAIDQDGKETDRLITPQELEQTRNQMLEWVDKTYPPNSAMNLEIRKGMVAEIQRAHEGRMKALWGAKTKYREDQYKSTGKRLIGRTYSELVQGGYRGAELFDKLQGKAEEIENKIFNLNDDYVPSNLNKQDRAVVILKAIKEQTPTSREEAEAQIEMLDNAKVGGQAIQGHPSFDDHYKEIKRKAQEVIAKSDEAAQVEAQVAKGVEILASKKATFDQLGLQDVEIPYGDDTSGGERKLPKVSKEAIKDKIKAAIRQQILDENPGADEYTLAEEFVRAFAGTGELSDDVRNVFKGLSLGANVQGQDPDTAVRAYKFYEAIRLHDPLNLDEYVGDEDVMNAMEMVRMFQETEFGDEPRPTVQEAMDRYLQYKREPWPRVDTRPGYKKQFNEWEESVRNEGDLTLTQIDKIKEQYNAFFGDRPVKPSDVRSYLDRLTQMHREKYVTFNGAKVEMPPGVIDKKEFQQKLKLIEYRDDRMRVVLEQPENEYLRILSETVLGRNDVRMQRTTGGYHLVKKGSSLPIRDENLDYIFIEDEDIERLYQQYMSEDLDKRLKNAQQLVDDKRVKQLRQSNPVARRFWAKEAVRRRNSQKSVGSTFKDAPTPEPTAPTAPALTPEQVQEEARKKTAKTRRRRGRQ